MPISYGSPRASPLGKRTRLQPISWTCGLAVGLCVALAPSCERSHGAESATRDEVETYPVASPRTEDVVLERQYVGEIRAIRYAEVRSRVNGILEAVAVDEGQHVQAGDLLFTLNSREVRQELLVAEAAVVSAEADVLATSLERDNSRVLFEGKVVAEAELALAEAKLAISRAQLEEAKAQAARAAVAMEFTQVRAAFDGRINRIVRKVGSAIGEDELLTTLNDASEVQVYFRMSERELLTYTKAHSGELPTEVGLVLADGSILPDLGAVDAVEYEVDPETGTLALRARFPNNAGFLRHGSRCKVVLRETLSNALLVPQTATFDVQGSLHVYVVEPDGMVRARKFLENCRAGNDFVIASGVAPSDTFVLEGVQRVRDGQRIVTQVRGEQ